MLLAVNIPPSLAAPDFIFSLFVSLPSGEGEVEVDVDGDVDVAGGDVTSPLPRNQSVVPLYTPVVEGFALLPIWRVCSRSFDPKVELQVPVR